MSEPTESSAMGLEKSPETMEEENVRLVKENGRLDVKSRALEQLLMEAQDKIALLEKEQGKNKGAGDVMKRGSKFRHFNSPVTSERAKVTEIRSKISIEGSDRTSKTLKTALESLLALQKSGKGVAESTEFRGGNAKELVKSMGPILRRVINEIAILSGDYNFIIEEE